MAFGKDNSGNGDDKLDRNRRVKRRLIEDRFPNFFDTALKMAIDLGEFDENSIHRVNQGDDKLAVYFTDGSTCEINPGKHKMFVYGQNSIARKFADLAAELYFPWGADENAVEESAKLSARASGKKPHLKVVSAGNESNVMSETHPKAETVSRDKGNYDMNQVANTWRSAGFSNVEAAADVITISIGRRRMLKDFGGAVEVYGKGKDREIAKAIIRKALIDWDGVVRVEGSKKLQEACWLEAQRRGATMVDFEPSPSLQSRWNLEERVRSRLPKRDTSIEHVASASDGRPSISTSAEPASEPVSEAPIAEAPLASEAQSESAPQPEPENEAEVIPIAPKPAAAQPTNALDMFKSIRPMHEVMPTLCETGGDEDSEDLTPTV